MSGPARQRSAGRGGLLAGGAVALAVLGPLLVQRGYVLTYDMVFVPAPPLDEALLGLGTSVARAVPSDLVVALASRVLPGDVVQRLVLAAVLVAGAWGAARLLPRGGPLAGAVAGTAYAWTAAGYERLVLGQWALLVSLAALPWVVAAADRLRRDGRWAPLLLALAGGAVGSPAGGALCGAVAVAVVAAGRSARRSALAVGLALLVVLPWAVPSLLRPGGVSADPAGFAAFAPRADTPLGAVGSVLTLGGVWNAQVEPPGRDTWAVAAVALALLAVAAWGLSRLAGGPGPATGWLRPLAACAAAGLVVALLPTVPAGADVLGALAAAVPGGGLLRDGQKYAAPYALLVAVGLGAAAARVPWQAAGVLLAAPVALVPTLAWGAGGRLVPVDHPDDAAVVRALVAADPAPAVSLPWSAYRQPGYNGGRTVLDPVPRLLPVPVVVDDDLPLADRTVAGEDPVAARLDPLLSGGGPLAEALAAEGVGWVVVARGEPGSERVADRLAGARQVHDGRDLGLWRLPAPAAWDPPAPPRLPVVLADVGVLVAVLAALGVVARDRGRRDRPPPTATVGPPAVREEGRS